MTPTTLPVESWSANASVSPSLNSPCPRGWVGGETSTSSGLTKYSMFRRGTSSMGVKYTVFAILLLSRRSSSTISMGMVLSLAWRTACSGYPNRAAHLKAAAPSSYVTSETLANPKSDDTDERTISDTLFRSLSETTDEAILRMSSRRSLFLTMLDERFSRSTRSCSLCTARPMSWTMRSAHSTSDMDGSLPDSVPPTWRQATGSPERPLTTNQSESSSRQPAMPSDVSPANDLSM